jgi:16S rRNA processing protein RimM
LLIELGLIVNRHGVRGELRVMPHNPDSELLTTLGSIVLVHPDGATSPHRIAGARRHKQFVLLRLAGVESVDAADALRGSKVAAPRPALPPAGADAAYHVDLIGCTVRTTDGTMLGTVDELIVTGSNDVCVVHGTGREYLIPLVADVIAELDTQARTITVRPLPGLLDA